jgi:hypothetical protein
LYFIPFFVSENASFDRILVRSASTFVGTATIRLGVYNNADDVPTSLLFDAGTASVTAANQTATITISETINAGWYWLALLTEVAATTNTFVAGNLFIIPNVGRIAAAPTTSNYRTAYAQASVAAGGLPASATTPGTVQIAPVIALRKT